MLEEERKVGEEEKGLKTLFKNFSSLFLATSHHHPASFPLNTHFSKEVAAEAGHINSSEF